VAPGEGALRLTRVGLFAVSAVGLAVAAHLIGGDDVPPLMAVLAVPAVMLAVNLLATRRRGPVGLFLGMGLTQVLLHVAFMTTSVTAGCIPPAPPPAMAGMAMDGRHPHLAAACAPVTGPLAHLPQLWPSASMALAHTLATALLVLLLARGEATVWALAACRGFRFRLPAVAVLPPAVRRLPVAAAASPRAPQTVHRRTVRRRGPPALACAAV
jgi:hypothetical protein